MDPNYGNEEMSTCGKPDWLVSIIYKPQEYVYTNKNNLQGDGYCDDSTNTAVCDWDGGDCCNPNAILDFCADCFCLDATVGGNEDIGQFNYDSLLTVHII